MKLTSNGAFKMLEEARRKTANDGWIDHSICVGKSGGKIAQALKEKGYNVDIEKNL